MPFPDLTSVAAEIAGAAAIELLPRFRHLAAHDIREKSPGEVVTIADEAMESRLGTFLTRLVPGSVVVGEEAASADPHTLELLDGEAPVWLLDPLDGTSNFAAGNPAFGVMVCLVWRGETVAAWIHHPVTGLSVVAERGSGAWMADRRVQIAARPEPLRAAIHGRFFPEDIRAQVDLVRPRFLERDPSFCAAITYVELATGELDVAVYYRLMPWDHAPGLLIHSEAGGYSTRLNGKPYSVSVHTGGLLVAPSEAVWRGMADVFVAPPPS